MNLPTREQLLERFSYNPEDGSLISDGREAGYPMKSGYRLLSVKKRRIYAHRAIWCMMTGDWPVFEIDHANGVKSDNRWCNLRAATRTENARNQGKTKKNTSGFKGVSFHTRVGRWRAVIETRFGHKHLGYFDDKETAFEAYQWAAQHYFGNFAKTV